MNSLENTCSKSAEKTLTQYSWRSVFIADFEQILDTCRRDNPHTNKKMDWPKYSKVNATANDNSFSMCENNSSLEKPLFDNTITRKPPPVIDFFPPRWKPHWRGKGVYLTKRFRPMRRHEELVGATQLRSTRTDRSSLCWCQGLDSH